MTNLRCNGSEQNLVDCMYSRDTDSGNHAGDVGIQCLESEHCNPFIIVKLMTLKFTV